MSGSSTLHQNILKYFLCCRYDREAQRRFVDLCLTLTRQRLRYFRAKGWSLPSIDLSVGDPLEAPSNDITGSILCKKDGTPFGRVFDFFRSRGITEFVKVESEFLWENFQSFLYRSIRQERTRLLDDEDPAKARIKKSVNEALLTDEYYRWKRRSTGDELVATAKQKEDPREDLPQISFEALLELVVEAFHESLNQRDLCRKVFDKLAGRNEAQNYLHRRQLVHAIVIVILREMDVEGLALPIIPKADHGIQQSTIQKAIAGTIESMKETVLARYVIKGKLTVQQSGLLATACEKYLLDLAHSGGTDSRRTYFDEVINGVARPTYEKQFKNIFDTLISKAEIEFGNYLRKLL